MSSSVLSCRQREGSQNIRSNVTFLNAVWRRAVTQVCTSDRLLRRMGGLSKASYGPYKSHFMHTTSGRVLMCNLMSMMLRKPSTMGNSKVNSERPNCISCKAMPDCKGWRRYCETKVKRIEGRSMCTNLCCRSQDPTPHTCVTVCGVSGQ